MVSLHTLEVVLLQGDVSHVTPLLVKEGAVCRRKSEHHGGSKNAEKAYYWRCEFAARRLLAQRRRPGSPLSAAIDVAPIADSI